MSNVVAAIKSAPKRVVKSVLGGLGMRLIRSPLAGEYEYETIYSDARYAPWNLDSEFLSTHKRIKSNTLVDLYRCWELWTLVEQTQKLRGAILEVGVWRGGTGALMAKRDLLTGAGNPVYLCDTFEGVVKAGPKDGFYKGGEHADTSIGIVKDLLSSLSITNAHILTGIFPDDTAHLIDPGVRFRLCHIDVDVYQSAKDVTTWIWDRLVPGGVIVFDDYGFQGCEGVAKFVGELAAQPDRLILHNLNGHGIVIKIAAAG